MNRLFPTLSFGVPTLWRYLLLQYLRVLSLAAAAFLAVLFVTKLHQIAQFAALGGSGTSLLKFALFLVPYVLPFTLPISCLISSILLFQRLSHTQELTAMRSCGLGLRQICGPILLAGVALSLFSFYVTSELATFSRLSSKVMRSQIQSINPLLLLQNTQLLRLGELYVDMRTVTSGEHAENLLLGMYNSGNDRINLITADELRVKDETLLGRNVCLISSASGKQHDSYDHLLIESQNEMEIPINAFTGLIKQAAWNLDADHLKLRLVLVRLRHLHNQLKQADGDEVGIVHKQICRIYTDLFKRISLATAVFSFTLLGCSFGVEISRFKRKRGLIYVLLLATLFLACYSFSKSVLHLPVLAALLLFLPHLLIMGLSVQMMRRTSQGIE